MLFVVALVSSTKPSQGLAKLSGGLLQAWKTQGAGSQIPEYDSSWKALISGSSCSDRTLTPKSGGQGGKITCERRSGVRYFKFPVGKFDIDEQVVVPANTAIEGNANPNSKSDKTTKPCESDQTYFVATTGISDPEAPYCGTDNKMQQGDAQKFRIGFLLNSYTTVRNINFQGKDTTRPYDNGNLCGGGVFETPGCVSPGFGDGVGAGWESKRTGCYDHTGKPNNLITGDGKGVTDVVIDSVRLNDLLPSGASQEALVAGHGSQVAVWVAMTQDGSATKNVKVTNLVSMLTRGDGINFHGNVQDSLVEDCHIENTGDDIYAFWGAYAENPSGSVFRNNVGKNPGVTRNYGYGVCVAVYGAKDVTITGTKCFDRSQPDWNPGQVPSGNDACLHGAYCNSCLAYVHDGWFGALYPGGNQIKIYGNEYLDMSNPQNSLQTADRPLIRSDPNSNAQVVTNG
eukprot:TRINITY_DN12359_c0_g1_i1.p1 TRINITY_DN12359_c0_g1~~TRINITY_DN12359_c0_g1_i1.p1  ORF type:complete len:457 (+),score=59.68 TRINITY_DN12359_c0_g1_i1:60-1430(+)